MDCVSFPPIYQLAADIQKTEYSGLVSRLSPAGIRMLWLQKTTEGRHRLINDENARKFGLDQGWVRIVTNSSSQPTYEIYDASAHK